MIAEFSLWRPKNLIKPKGILVLVPHSQHDGRFDWHDPKWQAFATSHSLAIVSCFFQDKEMGGFAEDYCDVRKSPSGQKLLDFVIKMFGSHTGSVYDLDVPLYLFGYSAGGQFNYEFTVAHPEYVAAFVVNKGGIYYSALAPEETRNTPGLFITGQNDSTWRRMIVRGIYMVNSVVGAKWDFVEEEGRSHEIGESESLARAFFEKVIKGE